ncbi:MAG: MOSC N-terminal beta barrel domain-containing protein, partial [Methylobacteriaceae bacterium]|nr:MOSC N-terminal beta barrel domain-containing protein [Methylobacteriaceae bacterium]
MQVAALYRYPVKGLSPEPLDRVTLKPGAFFPGDRLYAIENGPSGYDPAAPVHQPKIKFLMLARNARLAALATRYDAVTTALTIEQDGEIVAAGELATEEGRAAIERFIGSICADEMRGPARVLGAADGFRFTDSRSGFVSLINLASVRTIAHVAARSLDPLRFRANVYVSGMQAWDEFSLVGKMLHIGSVSLEPIKPIDRCFAIDVAPGRGVRDTNLLPLMERTFRHHN